MKAIIYRPCKNVMQSGMGNTRLWILQVKVQIDGKLEPVMGWSSSLDNVNQIKLYFETQEGAIAYAESHNYEYEIIDSKKITRLKKSYSHNFTKDLNLYYY